jgi:hypothetical protein
MADQQFPHEQRKKKKIKRQRQQHYTTARSCSLMKGVTSCAMFNDPVKTKAKVLNSI